VRRTADAGTSVELHVRPGVPHHFDSLAPDSDVARRAYADRVRVLRSL
jgi:acetyl esterase/lipase